MHRPRKRERFERTDVPRYNPHRTQIAIAVLVAVAVGLALLVHGLWERANASAHVGNQTLSAAIGEQSETTAADGYTVSSDVFTNVLMLTVDDINADSPQLQKAQLLVMDASTHKGYLVTIPLDAKVSVNGGDTTLSSCYASQGAAGCLAPLSTATNVKVSHVVVATDAVWEKIASFKGSGLSAILGSSADILKTLETDMSMGDVTDTAELLQSIGVGNLSKQDAPGSEGDNGSGGTWFTIDATALGVNVGLLTANA